MSDVAKTERALAHAGLSEEEIAENLFEPMVQEARSTLRRAMLNTRDQKLAVSVAESILDRAGHAKKKEADGGTTIVISESNINLLLEAQRDVFGG